MTTYKPSVGPGDEAFALLKTKSSCFYYTVFLKAKLQWPLEELKLNMGIIMQLLLALLGKIKVAKSTYHVQRELKSWRSSQRTVESREDKPELEGDFPTGSLLSGVSDKTLSAWTRLSTQHIYTLARIQEKGP